MSRHRSALHGFVRRLVGDDALAEDLTQETFLKAQRAAEGFRGEAGEKSWLCAIALNVVRDHFRASRRRPDLAPDTEALETKALEAMSCDADAEERLLQAEMSACINEFVMRLPHPQCDVVALHDAAGLSHQEIANVLDISPANSRVLLHRGRTALRAMLERNCILAFDSDAIPCEPVPRSGTGCREGEASASREVHRTRPKR
jgi:RNA polymerase sigma-70 factor (ECF subfamily)